MECIRKKLTLLWLLTAGIVLAAHQALAEGEDGNGFDLKLLYTGEEWGDVSGGTKRASTTINNFDAQLAFNPEKLFGWQGGSFLLDGLYNNGRSGNTLTGAGQQLSPIDNVGPQIFRVYQAWYNQDFFDGRTSILGGLYDLNSEFDTLDSAALFLNSGYGWNTPLDQSGHNGPSTFPNTSLGTRFREKWGDDQAWAIQGAVADGTPDAPNHPRETTIDINHKNGALLIGEGSYHPSDATKLLAGYWHYTAQFNDQLVTASVLYHAMIYIMV